ncbi:hypothetical protein HX037_05965 [Ignatzschineria indica]|uniref:hypothetical protein n=1 Tax=Ignatzschineria indica TaxID=472583 RepID=UPI002578DF5A|nr:hypothetical protein [Ignatzschineria indica]MDM1545431.1 hypothetical protein [Ignatzschineria indica]
MKTLLLRRVKPEWMITLILGLIVLALVAIIARDIMERRRIDQALEEAKTLISEVALSLTIEQMTTPLAVSNAFLAERTPNIADIIIYPGNYLEVTFSPRLINLPNRTLQLSFNSLDQLTRGNVECRGGDLPMPITPLQCRR